MAILDTPITTDDRGIKKVLGQKQPAIIVLHNGDKNKPLDDALTRAAKKHKGDLLVIRVNADENSKTYTDYGNPQLPALVTLTPAFFGRKTKSQAEGVRPADIRNHIAHLLEDKPLPQEKPKVETNSKSKKPLDVRDDTFRKEVLKSKTPVLVDFWAPWCGPCRSIAPYVEQVAKDYAGDLKVVKLNVDQNPVMSRRFQVQSIPTFMVFENGQPVNRTSGASPRAIQQLIGTVLS